MPRENPDLRYEPCYGCGSPGVCDGGYCARCRKGEMDAQRVASTDRAIERAMGIAPFTPVTVPVPIDYNPRTVDALRAAYSTESRRDILAAAGIADYDTRMVRIDRTKDARDEAWLKRTLASIPGQHPKP